MVIRRIENEHGCTLSKMAAMRTRGRSQVPSLLKLQIIDEVAGLFLRIAMPAITISKIPIVRNSVSFVVLSFIIF